MKVYLHGGFDDDNYDREVFFSQLQKIFEEENITQVLHLPFAHVGIRDRESGWEENRFTNQFPDIQFLDARYKEDIAEVDIDKVFTIITGGKTGRFLVETILGYQPLEDIVRNSKYIFASAAGIKCLGIKYSKKGTYTPALGIINYIGEGHVTHMGRRHLLDEHIQNYPQIDFSLGVEKNTITEREDGTIGKTRGTGKSYVVRK